MTRRSTLTMRLALGALTPILALGCAGPRTDGMPYPGEKPRIDVLDVQVFREGRHMSFTNTSARAFGPARVWVNGAYSHPLDGLEIGESVDLDLNQFVDADDRPFRGGGFFATERPSVLVLVEIETDAGRYDLVVVTDQPE